MLRTALRNVFFLFVIYDTDYKNKQYLTVHIYLAIEGTY